MTGKESIKTGWRKYGKGLALLCKKGAVFSAYTAAVLVVLSAVMLLAVTQSLHHTGMHFPAPIGGLPTGPETGKAEENNTAETAWGQSVQLVENKKEVEAAGKKNDSEQPVVPLRGDVYHQFGWQEAAAGKEWRYHTGIDVRSRDGTAVKAVYSGTVSDIFTDTATGLTMAVTSDSYVIYYGSLGSVVLQTGEAVKAGMPVGSVGSSFLEPDVHLHLAVKKDGRYINPCEIVYK